MRKPYPTDLSDAEWNYIEPHLPPPSGHGRPRIHSTREILDAIFYTTGCQGFFCKPPSDLGSFAVGACCQPISQASSLVVLRGPATVAVPTVYWLSPTLAHRVPA